MENKDIGDYGIERNETTLIKMLKVQVKLGSGNRIIWIRGAKNPARRMFFRCQIGISNENITKEDCIWPKRKRSLRLCANVD